MATRVPKDEQAARIDVTGIAGAIRDAERRGIVTYLYDHGTAVAAIAGVVRDEDVS
jgi:hypothetical protein